LRANKHNVSERAVAGTDQEVEFEDMTESELRFHKYAELKDTWEKENRRIVSNGLGYQYQEQARQWAQSHLTKRHDQTMKRRRVE
jgi:hypothetical protein